MILLTLLPLHKGAGLTSGSCMGVLASQVPGGLVQQRGQGSYLPHVQKLLRAMAPVQMVEYWSLTETVFTT
jgi:hypothetical protein